MKETDNHFKKRTELLTCYKMTKLYLFIDSIQKKKIEGNKTQKLPIAFGRVENNGNKKRTCYLHIKYVDCYLNSFEVTGNG